MPPKQKRYSRRAKESSPSKKLSPDSALAMKNLPFPKTSWSYSESTCVFYRSVLTDHFWSKHFGDKLIRIKRNKQALAFIKYFKLYKDKKKALSIVPEYAHHFQNKAL